MHPTPLTSERTTSTTPVITYILYSSSMSQSSSQEESVNLLSPLDPTPKSHRGRSSSGNVNTDTNGQQEASNSHSLNKEQVQVPISHHCQEGRNLFQTHNYSRRLMDNNKSIYGKKTTMQQPHNRSNPNPAFDIEIAVPTAADEEWGVSQLTLGFTQFEGGVVDNDDEVDLNPDTAAAAAAAAEEEEELGGNGDLQDVFEYHSPVETKKKETPLGLAVRDCELDSSQTQNNEKKGDAEEVLQQQVDSNIDYPKPKEQLNDAVPLKQQKPLPPVVAAAAKKKKKGPTDKALLEEDYDSTVCGSVKQTNGNREHCLDDGNGAFDIVNNDQSSAIIPSPSDRQMDEEQKQQEQQQKEGEEQEQEGEQLQKQSPLDKQEQLQQEEQLQQKDEQPPNKIIQQTPQQTILLNHSQIENIGKALSCPICCHSLKSSTFLPCGHAFCRSCLSNSLSMAPNCPVCRLKCTRRSGNSIGQLDEIVAGYKGVLRAFGFAPVVYSNRVGMTQLSPGMDGLEDEEAEGCDGDHKGIETGADGMLESCWGRKKRRILGVDEALEHHQIAQSNHEAFASYQKLQAPTKLNSNAAQQSYGKKRMTREEMEQINMTRRYRLLAEDQAAVMEADKEALEKVAKKKKMVVEATLEFAGKCDVDEGEEERVEKEKAEAVDVTPNETEVKVLVTKAPEESQDTFHTASKSNSDGAGKKDSAMPHILPPIESQDTFHTAKSEYSKETNRSFRESIATAPSPVILHDGNTAKKDRRVDSEEQKVENRESLATAASAIVLHDGNTVEKKKINDADGTPRRSGRYLPLSDEKLKAAPSLHECSPNEEEEVEFEAGCEPSQQSSVVSENSAPKPVSGIHTSLHPPVKRDIVVGSVVMVQSRTWPGINKHGGVGRVTKIDDSRGSKKYDVAYVLGGKEKGVDEIYVALNESEQSTNSGLTVAARVSRSAEKAPRLMRKRRARQKKSEPSSIPIYNDDELQQIPAEVLEWAGIRPAAKGKRSAKATGSKSNAPIKNTATKKRALAETSGNIAPPKKPKKQNIASNQDKPDRASTSFETAIDSMKSSELMCAADTRYSKLLSVKSDDAMTFHVVTSNLSDDETKILTSLTKMLKGANVILKIMKDFKRDKTQICITSASADSNRNITSKSRTLKVMRSTLLGLPILTPRWIESCLKEKQIVSPSGHMCVRTLPRKTTSEDSTFASFGVSKFAAAIDKDCKLLHNCSVFLCGKWKSSGQSTMKDLRILLDDAGATVINSAAAASKVLADMSNEIISTKRFIFLCDDSHLDADCGLNDSLFKAVKLTISEACGRVLIVHFNWLFDCISCAKFMPSAAYEPLSTRTKELWRMCSKGCSAT